jgi:hypothetical protein
MAKTTIDIDNLSKPAPRWFRRLKKAIGILVIAANAMCTQFYAHNPELLLKVQVWTTVGIGAILEALEALLANGEVYAPSETAMGKNENS